MTNISYKFPEYVPDGKGGFFKPSKPVAGIPITGVGVERESDLHAEIFDECRKRQWIVFHSQFGVRTRRCPGEPDFVILCNDSRTLLVECKNKKGKLTVEQNATAAWANKLGHTVHVVRSFEDFIAIADNPLTPNES